MENAGILLHMRNFFVRSYFFYFQLKPKFAIFKILLPIDKDFTVEQLKTALTFEKKKTLQYHQKQAE